MISILKNGLFIGQLWKHTINNSVVFTFVKLMSQNSEKLVQCGATKHEQGGPLNMNKVAH